MAPLGSVQAPAPVLALVQAEPGAPGVSLRASSRRSLFACFRAASWHWWCRDKHPGSGREEWRRRTSIWPGRQRAAGSGQRGASTRPGLVIIGASGLAARLLPGGRQSRAAQTDPEPSRSNRLSLRGWREFEEPSGRGANTKFEVRISNFGRRSFAQFALSRGPSKSRQMLALAGRFQWLRFDGPARNECPARAQPGGAAFGALGSGLGFWFWFWFARERELARNLGAPSRRAHLDG